MSRLGDMLQKERLARGLSAKDVAKKNGITEKYLLEVERGSRIIGDDLARRMLRTMGQKEELSSEAQSFESMVFEDEKPKAAAPSAPRRAQNSPVASSGEATGGAFMDALGGVVRNVPVQDAAGQVLSHQMLATQNGKIEGAPPDKVYFLQVGDSSMRGYRLRAGDLLLVVPASAPVDGAMMIVQEAGRSQPRRVTKQDGGKVLVQWFDTEPSSRVQMEKEIAWVGRAVRCEFRL